MIRRYLRYDNSNGHVLSVFTMQEEHVQEAISGETEAVVAYNGPAVDVWVDVSVSPVQVKPQVDNAAYLDGQTIKSIPNPSTVRVFGLGDGGHKALVEDGELTINSDLVGECIAIIEPHDPSYKTAQFKLDLT